MKRPWRAFLALAGGIGLSFLGLGILWIGTPWPRQLLMFAPFFLLAFALARTDEPGEDTPLQVLYGAAPLGALLTMFRDKDGSHLYPILIAACWAAGIYLGRRAGKRDAPKS